MAEDIKAAFQTGELSGPEIVNLQSALTDIVGDAELAGAYINGETTGVNRDSSYSRYLKMLDEVDAANKSGIRAREFAESKGVPSTLLDEDTELLDKYDYRMESEGEEPDIDSGEGKGDNKGHGVDEGTGDTVNPDYNVLIDTYKNMRYNSEILGQAHHLDQNAAFRDLIPKDEGLCIELEGSAFIDVGSQHYSVHERLESFWNDYRVDGLKYGDVPTIKEYNLALYDSLRLAGLTDIQAKSVVQRVIEQQLQYGLMEDSIVPRIPGKINLKK